MSGLRVLVADDEPLARQMLTSLLRGDADIATIIECEDGAAAGTLVERTRPDILFLDVEMPEASGLDVARNLAADGPIVVFVTAFSHYAPEAFGVDASDYIVKPFSEQRFTEALQRAKRRVRERRLALGDAGPRREPPPTPAIALNHLTVRTGDRLIAILPADIVWIEAEDYYVRVHSSHGRHLVRMSLASLEARLDRARFVRVHRAAIVNADAVRQVRGGHTLRLVLSDGAEVVVSRARRSAVEATLAEHSRAGRTATGTDSDRRHLPIGNERGR